MNGLNNSNDDVAECPLCMEPLEVDDLNFYPCTCGYQVSLHLSLFDKKKQREKNIVKITFGIILKRTLDKKFFCLL